MDVHVGTRLGDDCTYVACICVMCVGVISLIEATPLIGARLIWITLIVA